MLSSTIHVFLLGAVVCAMSIAQGAVSDAQLSSIKLPPGFSISVFASDVGNARSMTLSPSGNLYVGTRSAGNVYVIEGAVQSAVKGEKASKARTIASGLNMPNGVAFYQGDLYVAEVSRISRYPKIESNLSSPPKPIVIRNDYPAAASHGWKYVAVGPDGWLYVPVGAPCNLCLSENPLFASLTRLSLDGKMREIVAHGIRNTVGFAWHPQTKELWFADNGADGLGDDVPTDELNRVEKSGSHFGYPFCHQGDLCDSQFGQGKDCSASGPYTPPAQKLGPHVAALGMKFYTGTLFPETYRGRVFIAEHGSWNRSRKIGYRVSMVPLNGNQAAGYEVFAEGWLRDGQEWGRPVDVLVMPDGSLLVSDDFADVIYRITYNGAGVANKKSGK